MVGCRSIAMGVFSVLLLQIMVMTMDGSVSRSHVPTPTDILISQYCNPNVDPNCDTSS